MKIPHLNLEDMAPAGKMTIGAACERVDELLDDTRRRILDGLDRDGVDELVRAEVEARLEAAIQSARTNFAAELLQRAEGKSN